MTGGIERLRDIVALCPTGRTVHVQSDDVSDVLAAMDSAERAITRAHAALATERERAAAAVSRADAAEAEVARLREQVEEARSERTALREQMQELRASARGVLTLLEFSDLDDEEEAEEVDEACRELDALLSGPTTGGGL